MAVIRGRRFESRPEERRTRAPELHFCEAPSAEAPVTAAAVPAHLAVAGDLRLVLVDLYCHKVVVDSHHQTGALFSLVSPAKL